MRSPKCIKAEVSCCKLAARFRIVGKQEVEFSIAPGPSIHGLRVTCKVNSGLECESYTGVGFDAFERDGKARVSIRT